MRKYSDVKKWAEYILRILKGNIEENFGYRRHSQAISCVDPIVGSPFVLSCRRCWLALLTSKDHLWISALDSRDFYL